MSSELFDCCNFVSDKREKQRIGNVYVYNTCINQNGDAKELSRGEADNSYLKIWLSDLRRSGNILRHGEESRNFVFEIVWEPFMLPICITTS